MFASAIEHDAVGFSQASHSPQAAAVPYAGLFTNHVFDRMTPRRRLCGDGFCVDEALVEGRAIGRPLGVEGPGRPVQFQLLHTFEFADGGITRENAWLTVLAIRQQLVWAPSYKYATAREHRTALRARQGR